MTPRLSLRKISKSFEGTRALSEVSFDVLPGEVHVLAGENGAGKSTLIKILSGVHGDYDGELFVDGELRRFTSPVDATRAGIATIHQELSLVGNLSVADNLSFGSGEHAFGAVHRRADRARAEELLSALGLAIAPDAPVETLGLAERQLIEIARALGRNARLFVMDEPTSALAEPDAERLFSRIERLVASGASVVYISHRLEEMSRLATRITVLRDGQHVFTRTASDVTRAELVLAMAGSAERTPRRETPVPAARTALLSVRELAHGAEVRDVSFELESGEILGVAGLAGSGAASLLDALFGAKGPLAGRVLLRGKPYVPSSPRAAFASGIALVPGDRETGVFPAMSVTHNATLSSLSRFSPRFVVASRRERMECERSGARVRLKAPSLEAPAAALSGGNQQKLALLRCLLTEPRLLLCDDPTRGVDVGAKAEIHELFRELARGGMGILFRSSELDELLALAGRVVVFHRGRLVAMLSGSELTRERLLEAMLGAAA